MFIVTQAIWLALLCTKVFALVDCVRRKQYDFEMSDTLPKNIWLVILSLAVFIDLMPILDSFRPNPIGPLSLLGTLGAFVYLAQLRSSSY